MSLLDKFKSDYVSNPKEGNKNAQVDNGNTNTNTKPTSKSSTSGSNEPVSTTIKSRFSSLAARTGSRPFAETTPERTEAAKAKEAAKINRAVTKVPEDIYKLNSDIYNIEGFEADKFSQLLSSTYVSLVEDEPDLPRLSELINTNLRQYEELCYLLKPEQLGLYFDSLMKIKSAYVKTTKKKTTSADLVNEVNRAGGMLDL